MGEILIRDFHDALNAVSQPLTKKLGYLDAMENVIVSTRNTVEKKPGHTPINSSAYGGGEEILSIFDYLLQQGDIVRSTIFQQGSNLYALHHQSGVAGVIKSGLTGREFQYTVSGSTVYMGNGVNMLKYYTIAGYALFSDFAWDINDGTRTQLAESFISKHGKARNCASISITLQRAGTIPSSTKVTIEIQGDDGGKPSLTAIANGTSNQIDGSDITSNWLWTAFTFGSTLPILEPDVTYWIVLKTSTGLTGGALIRWGTDTTTPDFDDGNFSVFDTQWVDQPKTVGLFHVFVEPDKWGIDAPATAPSVSGSATNNPAYDTIADQDADEELDGLPATTAELAQSWEFTGDVDRTVSSVQLYLKKTGLPLGDMTVEIRNDVDGRPSVANLLSFPLSSMGDLTTSYQFITFTAVPGNEITLRPNTRYWLHLSGGTVYRNEFVTGVTSISWGVDSSAPTFAKGEFAREPGVQPWDVDNTIDAIFRITSSVQSSGGRKYAYSFKNSVTGHVSNRSPGSIRSGGFDILTVNGFEVPDDPQVDEIVLWATTDGGEIFFLLDQQTVNTSTVTAPLIASQSTGVPNIISVGQQIDEIGSYSELLDELDTESSWITITIAPLTLSKNTIAEFDLALGAAGVEVVLVNKIVFKTHSDGINTDGGSPQIQSFPIKIPTGSRIAVRASDDRVGFTTYEVGIQVYNPDLSFIADGLTQFTDEPTESNLDFTVEAPLCNFPPGPGDIISRAKDSIIVAGVRSNLHRAFYSAGLGQTLVGVPEESFPAFNFVSVPGGSERIWNVDSIDGSPVLFVTDQIFTIAGETPESFRAKMMRGGKGIGSVSKLGSAATSIGLFFMSTDRKVFVLPTINHIPQLVSEVIEDEFERIATDSALMTIRSMEKVRMEYLHHGDRHWMAVSIPTGVTSNLNNELWIYDLDLHNIHPGSGWMGPLINDGGEGFQTLRVIIDATHDKNLYFGDDGGFIRKLGLGNQDDGVDFTSSVTLPFMDDNKPNMVKDWLTIEIIVPVGQTVPSNFLQVSYDSETDFETVELVQVVEMERGASDHKYRGYLMRQSTRIKVKVNFAVEDAVGELWQIRMDYDDLYETKGLIHDANA